jgi:hypothetical protein
MKKIIILLLICFSCKEIEFNSTEQYSLYFNMYHIGDFIHITTSDTVNVYSRAYPEISFNNSKRIIYNNEHQYEQRAYLSEVDINVEDSIYFHLYFDNTINDSTYFSFYLQKDKINIFELDTFIININELKLAVTKK